jgi:hypothetical protein
MSLLYVRGVVTMALSGSIKKGKKANFYQQPMMFELDTVSLPLRFKRLSWDSTVPGSVGFEETWI